MDVNEKARRAPGQLLEEMRQINLFLTQSQQQATSTGTSKGTGMGTGMDMDATSASEAPSQFVAPSQPQQAMTPPAPPHEIVTASTTGQPRTKHGLSFSLKEMRNFKKCLIR